MKWWPMASHPSPLQAQPRNHHTRVAFTSPAMSASPHLLCKPNVKRRGEIIMLGWDHHPQMGTTSVEAHPWGWMGLILPILCLLQRVWQKGPLYICSSLYGYAIQAKVAPHKDHTSCTIDEKLLVFGKWSNRSEQCRIQFMLNNPWKSPAYKGVLEPGASEYFRSITQLLSFQKPYNKVCGYLLQLPGLSRWTRGSIEVSL